MSCLTSNLLQFDTLREWVPTYLGLLLHPGDPSEGCLNSPAQRLLYFSGYEWEWAIQTRNVAGTGKDSRQQWGLMRDCFHSGSSYCVKRSWVVVE